MAQGKTGGYLFLIALALAVLAALVPTIQSAPWVGWALVILGLIVGFLNVTAKESTDFLVASIALLLVGGAASVAALGTVIGSILANIVQVVAPAALIVALKEVWALAKD